MMRANKDIYYYNRTSALTLSEKTLHLLTRLIVVDEDVKAQALEALEQLACVSVRAVAYIHPCRDNFHGILIPYASVIITIFFMIETAVQFAETRLPYPSFHQSFCC